MLETLFRHLYSTKTENKMSDDKREAVSINFNDSVLC